LFETIDGEIFMVQGEYLGNSQGLGQGHERGIGPGPWEGLHSAASNPGIVDSAPSPKGKSPAPSFDKKPEAFLYFRGKIQKVEAFRNDRQVVRRGSWTLFRVSRQRL
jgi:hypothetical protein